MARNMKEYKLTKKEIESLLMIAINRIIIEEQDTEFGKLLKELFG